MPKELIYSEPLYVSSDDPDPDRNVVEVNWSREGGHVALVTRAVHSDGTDYFYECDVAHDERYDAPVPVPMTEKEMSAMKGGFYVDLDRDAINRIIRNLRRARDQAFGRDE
jgi:hypothetical protein